MIRVEKFVIIKRPIEEVYAYSQNSENYTKWQADVVSMHMEKGPDNVVGSIYKEVRKFLGQDLKTTLEITVVKENEKWAAKVIKGPVHYEVTMVYEKVPEGTKLTTIVSGETRGFFKLAEGIVSNSLEKTIEEDQNRLKTILESS